jgi:nucleoside-diphosphate-sugar epimerase
MKILITGSTGFVGNRLIPKLKSHDLCFYKRGDAFMGNPDLIYHLAAELHDVNKMYESNVLLSERLYHAFPKTRIIYIGSSTEYGITDKPRNEEDECRPVTLYALTKYMGTKIFQQNKENLILRPFLLYGENHHGFFQTVITQVMEGRTVEIWEGKNDWIHVDDIVNALVYFGKRKLHGQIINIGTGVPTTNGTVIKIMEKYLGKIKIKKHKGLYRQDYSPFWVADTSKARSLGWSSSITLENGLRRMVEATL